VSISEPFIRRPVATVLLMFGLLLAGLVAYKQLPVSALPQVEYPTIVVATYLPGASAETMASSVTTPLERQLGQVPSLAQMTSISSFGWSQITLQFTLDREIDSAEQDVQAAINAASSLLPRTLPSPPTYSKSNPADTPIITIAVTSDALPLDKVNDAADSILAQKISQLSGVGLVTLNGSQKPAIRVQVDPDAIAAAGLSLEDVRGAIVAANVNQPKGNLDGARQDWTLATNDQINSAEGFKTVVVAYKNGAPIRLSAVANVVDGVENAQLAGWADQKRGIIVNVQRQPGANVIEVADRVKALLPQLASSMPPGVSVRVISDRTETVRASVEDVQFTLVLTIFLVVAVIYVFLHSVRATIIPGVAVPLSLIGTFGVMWGLGYSLDNLSLMALTISTGFVVDDAIVMVENVARYIEMGHKPFRAAIEGAKQIGFTIVSLTVSLIAVLIPLLFMQGLVGRLFREFAVTLAAAIAVSAVLSLTLTPMMAGHLLTAHDHEAKPNAFQRGVDAFWNAVVAQYDKGLRVVLRFRKTTLLVTFATVAATAWLSITVPKGFFPTQDTGMILGVTEAAQDVSFPRMAELQQSVADEILKEPEVAAITSFIGSDGSNPTTNSGRISVVLKPRAERGHIADLIERIRQRAAKIDGISLYLQPVQDLQIDSRAGRTPYVYTLEDADEAELREWAPKIRDALAQRSELRDVSIDDAHGGTQLALTIDRDTAARLAVPTQSIDDILYDAFGQRQISTIYTQLNQYRVILEVTPELQSNPGVLRQIYAKATTGEAVPLSSFARFEPRDAAVAVRHQGQFPVVDLSFDVAPGESLGAAVAVIERTVAQLAPPRGLRAGFAGAAAAFGEALGSEPILILAALVTVYIVLGVLYESFIHPITILSTLPSAGVGAILALLVTGTQLGVVAIIGIILLIGIVKKNAIMMIDFALEAERDEGLTPLEAIHKACLLRFRPIMMTTLAALLGGLPLALEQGTGSELRRPLGITIVGGLIVSQVLTLFTTPVVYLALDRLVKKEPKRVSHPTPPLVAAEGE
jgi:multidrug efflux pump